jgi:hypothetical protein
MCPVFSLRIFEYFTASRKMYGVSIIDGALSVFLFCPSTILATKVEGRHFMVAKEPELIATPL